MFTDLSSVLVHQHPQESSEPEKLEFTSHWGSPELRGRKAKSLELCVRETIINSIILEITESQLVKTK